MVESTTKTTVSSEPVDQLGFEHDPEVRKSFLLGIYAYIFICLGAQENLLWSSKLSKFNKYNWVQERNLVITQYYIYNLKKKGTHLAQYYQLVDVKRIISLDSLAGLTKSLHKNSKEFVLHVKKEHDYRLRSDHREQIIKVIKLAYTSRVKKNLPIYGIKNKDLREFTTTEKDRDKGISRIPLQLARLNEEDIMEEEGAKKKLGHDQTSEILENYEKNMEHRMQAYSQSRKSQMDKEDRSLFDRKERSETLYSRCSSEVVNFDDFEIKQIIGKGTFGKVYLVQNTTNGRLYAMKSIRKDIVIEHDSIENLHLEKLILLQVNHPFIISMQYVFQKSFRIYFVMDFIGGGELFKHLSDAKRFDEKRTKFYAAQVAVALGYLHESRIIYRDLKPENILLGTDGYILLADFGLAKLSEEGDEPNSFCGTPEYLSPEMVVGTGHDHTLDWWALGILMYEMLIGIPPFYNKNKHQMYYLIQHAPIRWPDRVKHGIDISDDAKDLVEKLLQKDKKSRIGQKDDAKEVLAHPFFKDMDIQALLKKKLEAPYIPKVKPIEDQLATMKVAESILPEQSKKVIASKKEDFEKFGFEYSQDS